MPALSKYKNMKTEPHFRIIAEQAFTAVVPMYMQNADGTRTPIAVETLTNVRVNVRIKNGAEISGYTVGRNLANGILLDFPQGIGLHVYSVQVTAELAGRVIKTVYMEAFEGVSFNRDTTYENYVTGDDVILPECVFVLSADTAAIAALQEQLEQAVAQYNAAKQAYIEKAEMLDGVAQQGTNDNATNTTILDRVNGLQGGDETATLTGIQTLIINEGIPLAHEYAQEINEIIGEWENE